MREREQRIDIKAGINSDTGEGEFRVVSGDLIISTVCTEGAAKAIRDQIITDNNACNDRNFIAVK